MSQEIADAIKRGDNSNLKKSLTENPSLADSKTEAGISLLQYAVYCGNAEASDLIQKFKKTDLDIFEAACTGEESTVVQLLKKDPKMLNAFSSDGFTLLGLASYFGRYTLVKLLLEKGADPAIPSDNPLKVTPVHSACSISHYEITELLLKNGAGANAKQMQGYTPLHSTAHNGKKELTQLLIDHGADVNARSDDGKTPLSMALEKGFKDTADLIINYGGKE